MPHYLSTPKKASIIVAINIKDPLYYSNNNIFRKFGVNKTTGYKVLQEANTLGGERTFYLVYIEIRGRKKKLSEEYITVLIDFLEKNRFDGRTIPYERLLNLISINLLYTVSRNIIQRALKYIDFQRYITCEQ
ncbi:hypothetical protein QR685DRAFT_432101 [Neurospora intermedia]|uniref:Uncharacterized protein n=1 Tax=Neurospora intermedia TaxID=5142 RepID=A0ABR3DSJ8_NEUIN